MISSELFDTLRGEGESSALDFKERQYRFANATDNDKGELLKDLLAFANAWRRTDAYILLGVRERPGERAEVVGITESLDDASLQQFVNDKKTQRPLHFSYRELTVDGKLVAAIHIPRQQRPLYLTRDYGKLKANAVYFRQGSSTATATPDDIAKMVRDDAATVQVVGLELAFADPDARVRVTPRLVSRVLRVPPPDEIPEFQSPPRQLGPGVTALGDFRLGMYDNTEYLRELVAFTHARCLVLPVWFALHNAGDVTAQDVRIELRVNGATAGVHVLDRDQYPEEPVAEINHFAIVPPRHDWSSPQFRVEQRHGVWIIEGSTAKVQPKATVWFADPVYIGAETSRTVDVETTIYADNLAVPIQQRLQLQIESSTSDVTLLDILGLERERRGFPPLD
jgi:hypothetical protein